jgi:signal transduction histidine kinase
LQEAVDEVQAAASLRRITLLYRCELNGISLSLDRIKLKQAVLNLLTNAVEASSVGDQVELTVQSDAEADVIQVRVADHGPGIAESNLGHVFSPFFSTKAQGTGLGLTFAQKIVSLHGGRIIAENNPQGGATFIIELPRQSLTMRV